MTLTEFLLARIAEDGATALAANEDAWTRVIATEHEGLDYAEVQDAGHCYVMETSSLAIAQHAMIWKPARALAECEAKRRIVAEHSPIGPGVNINTSGYAPKDGPVCGCCGEPEWGCVAWPCLTLRALALPYADHPNFDPAWRVS